MNEEEIPEEQEGGPEEAPEEPTAEGPDWLERAEQRRQQAEYIKEQAKKIKAGRKAPAAGAKAGEAAGEAAGKAAAGTAAKAGSKFIPGAGQIMLAADIASRLPVIGKIGQWCGKHKIIVIILLILILTTGPVLGFAIGYAGGQDGSGGGQLIGGTYIVNGVALYKQGDSRWGSKIYDGAGGRRTLASSGCGVTAIAMVLATYGFNETPATVADYAIKNGYRRRGGYGTDWGIFPAIARDYNLELKHSGQNIEATINYLSQGYPVVASMKGPSKFTRGGHFIVLTGYKDGVFYINDPGGRNITQATTGEVSGALLNSWVFIR